MKLVRRVTEGTRSTRFAGAGGTHDSGGFEATADCVGVEFPSWAVFVTLGLKKSEIFDVIAGALVVVIVGSAGGIIWLWL